MEFLRRLFVVIFVCSAVWFLFYTPLYPLVRVKLVDFAEEYKKEVRRQKITPDSLLPYSSNVPIGYEHYIAKKIKGKTIEVKGGEWESLFLKIGSAIDQASIPEEMQRRTSPQYKQAGFYFYASEPPFNILKDRLSKYFDSVYLEYREGKYLKIEYKAYTDNSFHIGSGLTDYPKPPAWLMYPYRKYSLWLMIASIALLLLPTRRHEKDSIHFKTWFITGNDVCFAILLVALPFAAPMAIMGGATQVFFTEGIFLLPIFWLLAAIGVWGIVFIMPRFASFEIEIKNDGIKSHDSRGVNFYQFKDMQYFQWVTFKRPRWLIFFAWIFLLAGRRGGTNLFILSTLTHAGIGIRLRDDVLFYLNTSNPMGQSVLNQNAVKIVEILQEKGVVEKKEEIIIRSMGLEPSGTKRL